VIADFIPCGDKLTASDAPLCEHVGDPVSISGDMAAVGNHFDDASCGSAYVFSIECKQTDIAAVSEWGLVVMVLLVLAAGTVVLRRRSADACN